MSDVELKPRLSIDELRWVDCITVGYRCLREWQTQIDSYESHQKAVTAAKALPFSSDNEIQRSGRHIGRIVEAIERAHEAIFDALNTAASYADNPVGEMGLNLIADQRGYERTSK